MLQVTVGIRELEAQLSGYIRQVKSGTIVVITEGGKPVAQIVPLSASLEARLQALTAAGLTAWSGRKWMPMAPVARPRGDRMASDLLLEARG